MNRNDGYKFNPVLHQHEDLREQLKALDERLKKVEEILAGRILREWARELNPAEQKPWDPETGGTTDYHKA